MKLTTFLKNNLICGHSLQWLNDVFTFAPGREGTYEVLSPGVIMITDHKNNKKDMLKCISEYYSADGKKARINKASSPYIKCYTASTAILGEDRSSSNPACAECHLACIRLLEDGKIKRI